MKGRSGPRYDVGGKLQTTTIAGVKSGNRSNPRVMKIAGGTENRNSYAAGGRCGLAEGGSARPRLDRPGRKMAKLKRAAGGGVDDYEDGIESPRDRAIVDNMINEAPSMDEINRQLGIKPKSNVAQNGSAGLPGRKSGGKVGFHPGGEKGKLHRELGVSEDKKIPAKRLAKAANSDNPEIARDAKRAETMKKWKH